MNSRNLQRNDEIEFSRNTIHDSSDCEAIDRNWLKLGEKWATKDDSNTDSFNYYEISVKAFLQITYGNTSNELPIKKKKTLQANHLVLRRAPSTA